ncbi:MAG: M1 family metallopeptidase [Opitutaceae bacterium]
MRLSFPRPARLWPVFLSLLPALLLAEARFSFDTTPGLLPKTVVPQHYELRLEPDLEARTFTGEARITVVAREAVTEVKLQALELTFDHIALADSAATAIESSYDGATQILTLPIALEPGTHTLVFNYRGKIDTAAQGFFVDRYKTADGFKLMLGTQMEVADARRVFPSWDEPVFRATFDITVVVPEKMTAVSNMPEIRSEPLGDGRKAVTFDRSPSMPTYLVAICAAEFEIMEDTFGEIQIRVLATEGKLAGAAYPLAISRDILAYQTDYFGVPYPLPKLDHVGVPNAFSGFGAMENWGCITYIDTDLLMDPATSSQSDKERVYEVVAHEVAHQWFGNIVTMAWWDNLWLNEGFASWFEAKTQDALNPDWHVWLRSNAGKERAMALDARASTHPIQQTVRNEAEALNGFDAISYMKGQAFIRMLENYVGEADFRDGIRLYIKRHAYSNTTTADLWAALEEASGKPVGQVAADWTERPGFPIIHASLIEQDGAPALHLKQSRFTMGAPDETAAPWSIPVAWAALEDIEQPAMLLFNTRETIVPLPVGTTAVKLNVGNTGFYRVQYDDALAEGLLRDIPSLPVSDQLNLLSDTWALVRAGRLPAPRYLELAGRLATSEHHALLEQIIGSFGVIDGLQEGEPGRRAWQAWAVQMLHPLLDRYGWEAKPGESPLDGALRADVIRYLGHFGDAGVIATARQLFAVYRENPAALDGNLISPVLSITGRYADRAAYDQLHELARNAMTTQAKRRAYGAMQNALDPTLIKETMALSLGDEMPAAEANLNLQRIAFACENPDLVMDYVLAHFDRLIARVGSYETADYLPGIMRSFNSEESADLLMDFTARRMPPEALPVAARAAEGIRDKARLKREALPVIDAWIRTQLKQAIE